MSRLSGSINEAVLVYPADYKQSTVRGKKMSRNSMPDGDAKMEMSACNDYQNEVIRCKKNIKKLKSILDFMEKANDDIYLSAIDRCRSDVVGEAYLRIREEKQQLVRSIEGRDRYAAEVKKREKLAKAAKKAKKAKKAGKKGK